MPTTNAPIQELADRIQRQEAELAKLRQELESRRKQLSELTHRKEELHAELAKVEKELAAVGQTSVPALKVAVRHTPVKAVAAKSAAKFTGAMSLPAYLVTLVRQAKRPITRKELAEQVVHNKFPTTSKNVDDMVKSRVYDLVKKGVLRQANDSAGLIVAQGTAPTKTEVSKQSAGAPKSANKKAASAKPAATTSPVKLALRQSLHDVVTHVLATSSRPLTAQQLAERVKKSGYASKSKDLKNVIWSGIGKFTDIEHVSGEGYRLKKGKVSGAKVKG